MQAFTHRDAHNDADGLDPLGLHAEAEQSVALGREVVLIGGASGIPDKQRAHGAPPMQRARAGVDDPWAIEDHAPLAVVVPVDHLLHVVRDGEQPARVEVGDVALLQGPAPYVLTDELGTAVTVVIREGQRCAAPDGSPLDGLSALGTRSWGAPKGSHTFVTGV